MEGSAQRVGVNLLKKRHLLPSLSPFPPILAEIADLIPATCYSRMGACDHEPQEDRIRTYPAINTGLGRK